MLRHRILLYPNKMPKKISTPETSSLDSIHAHAPTNKAKQPPWKRLEEDRPPLECVAFLRSRVGSLVIHEVYAHSKHLFFFRMMFVCPPFKQRELVAKLAKQEEERERVLREAEEERKRDREAMEEVCHAPYLFMHKCVFSHQTDSAMHQTLTQHSLFSHSSSSMMVPDVRMYIHVHTHDN